MSSVVGQESAILHNLRFLVSLAWFDLLLTDEERHTLERMSDNAGLSEKGRKQAQEWIDRMPGFPEQLVMGCQGFMSPEDIILAAYYIAYVDGNLDPKEEIAIGMGAEILGIGPTRMMEIKAKFLELSDREEALKLPEWRAPKGTEVQETPKAKSSEADAKTAAVPAMPDVDVDYNKDNPFQAKLKTNRGLSGEKSMKDVRHYEIDLSGGGKSLDYKVGDALGVWPTNDPELVGKVIKASGFDAGAEVTVGEEKMSFEQALQTRATVTKFGRAFFSKLADKFDGDTAKSLLEKENKDKLKEFTDTYEVIDVLEELGAPKCSPDEFIAGLTAMRGRLYSISSSPKAHANEVHLTVRRVQYEQRDRTRKGIASNWLARSEPGTTIPCYLHSTQTFLCPTGDTNLIMCGPGTGIAPFRAFIEERVATKSTGLNWLFFGEQLESEDFLYKEEMQKYEKDGSIRLTIAWSRSGDKKVYVQDRIKEHSAEVFGLFENGGVFAICGDARRMAKDVDGALHEVVEKESGKDTAYAKDYLKAMKKEGRYLRDVY